MFKATKKEPEIKKSSIFCEKTFEDFYEKHKNLFKVYTIDKYINSKDKNETKKDGFIKLKLFQNLYNDDITPENKIYEDITYEDFFTALDKFYNENKDLLYYNFYKILTNEYLSNSPDLFKVNNITHNFSFFKNILNNENDIINKIINKIIDKINIKKIDINSINDTEIYLLNINNYNNLIVQKYNNYNNYSNLVNIIRKYNLIRYKRNHIGDITNAPFYSINYSSIDTNMNDIIICILFSNQDIYINKLKEKFESYMHKFLINNIDGSGSYNKYFKKILLLFKIFIDNVILKKTKGGSSIKNSYQLYMNDKNKYYISYNNKNIYLNKNNTYKKKNKLYLKINNETEVIIKT